MILETPKETTFSPKQTLNSTSNKEDLIRNIIGAPSGESENMSISRKKINKSIKLVRYNKKVQYLKNPSIRRKKSRIEKYQWNTCYKCIILVSLVGDSLLTHVARYMRRNSIVLQAGPLCFHCGITAQNKPYICALPTLFNVCHHNFLPSATVSAANG